jgi:hypothetical protein
MSHLIQNVTKAARTVAAVTFATTIFPLSASAVTTTYTNAATFIDNTSDTYLENFNLVTNGDIPSPQLFSQGAFSYSVSDPGGQLYSGTGNTGSRYLGEGTRANNATITFTSGNVTAVGGNFFLTDIKDDLATGNITLTLNDGSVINLTSPTSGATPFGGFTTGGAIITSLTLSGDTSAWESFDNLYVGTASAAATAVPEPFTILGTIFGAGYGVSLKRKLAKNQQDKTDVI